MNLLKFIPFIIIYFNCAFFCIPALRGQNITIEGFGGHSYFVEKNAGGYDLGIGLYTVISKNNSLGLSFSHTYNDVSPLPSDLSAAKIVLKEESNRLPLGFGLGEWSEDYNWPDIRLEEQPNRYFRFNVGLHYLYKAIYKKHRQFTFALGAVLSYRDESEMIRLVETTKIAGSPFVRPTYDHSIPIFSYNTYMDLGTKIDFTYYFKKLKILNFGVRTSCIYFPKSNDVMVNNGLVISFCP